jgi:hypothetical protein
MRSALRGLPRFLATVIHAKHRLFVWLPEGLVPSHSLIVFATDQDAMFGLLHSRIHELWALVMGSALEDRPRYTPNTTFETFPFPAGWRESAQNKANTDEHREKLMNTNQENHSFIGVHRCSSVANPSFPPVAKSEKSKEIENHRYTPMNTDKAKEHPPSIGASPDESAANRFPAGWHECEENVATKDTKDTKQFFSVPFVPFVANPVFSSVAEAARLLNEARDRWLNPEGASESELKKRTLTALYNDREAGWAAWLNNLHRDLDRAVLAAYGWSDLAEPLFAAEDTLRAANPKGDALGLPLGRTEAGQALLGRLLALNLERNRL